MFFLNEFCSVGYNFAMIAAFSSHDVNMHTYVIRHTTVHNLSSFGGLNDVSDGSYCLVHSMKDEAIFVAYVQHELQLGILTIRCTSHLFFLPQFIQAKRELNDPENALIGAFAGITEVSA